MAKFEFPKNPGTERENPFEDARGENPFSDGTPEPSSSVAENVFAPPEDSEGRSYTPGDYEAIMVPNAKGARRLAILGVVPAGLGAIAAAIGVAATGGWLTPLFYALPFQFAALATSVPACIIARRDLRAIKAGAMSDAGRSTSRFALRLGLFGTLVGALPVVLYFVFLFV